MSWKRVFLGGLWCFLQLCPQHALSIGFDFSSLVCQAGMQEFEGDISDAVRIDSKSRGLNAKEQQEIIRRKVRLKWVKRLENQAWEESSLAGALAVGFKMRVSEAMEGLADFSETDQVAGGRTVSDQAFHELNRLLYEIPRERLAPGAELLKNALAEWSILDEKTRDNSVTGAGIDYRAAGKAITASNALGRLMREHGIDSALLHELENVREEIRDLLESRTPDRSDRLVLLREQVRHLEAQITTPVHEPKRRRVAPSSDSRVQAVLPLDIWPQNTRWTPRLLELYTTFLVHRAANARFHTFTVRKLAALIPPDKAMRDFTNGDLAQSLATATLRMKDTFPQASVEQLGFAFGNMGEAREDVLGRASSDLERAELLAEDETLPDVVREGLRENIRFYRDFNPLRPSATFRQMVHSASEMRRLALQQLTP